MEIYFTITAKKEHENELKEQEIDFMLEFNEDGECVDGQSFNPVSGWTNYSNWHDNWMEMDEDMEELLDAIKEYSCTMELEQMVAEFEVTDINYMKNVVYECNNYTFGEYEFGVMCTDIEN